MRMCRFCGKQMAYSGIPDGDKKPDRCYMDCDGWNEEWAKFAKKLKEEEERVQGDGPSKAD